MDYLDVLRKFLTLNLIDVTETGTMWIGSLQNCENKPLVIKWKTRVKFQRHSTNCRNATQNYRKTTQNYRNTTQSCRNTTKNYQNTTQNYRNNTRYWRTHRISLGTRPCKRGGCPIWRWRSFAEMFVSKGKSYS